MMPRPPASFASLATDVPGRRGTSRLRFLTMTLLLLCVAPATRAQDAGRPGGVPQGQVLGTVVGAETAEPVVSATVGVWRSADSTLVTGAVTEGDGRFVVEGLREDVYDISVSFVGYTSQTVANVAVGGGARRVDLGVIRLAPNTEMLDEVEVNAERASLQIEIDRMVYNTANAPVAVGGTATNVLETIPSVDVDIDGNISLRGSGNVAVLINGRPAPVSGEYIATYLRQLPAGSIERVEVIPNPSARYEPDGMGGIINIVLKEEAELGLGGTVVAGGDTQGGYSASGTFTYGRGPLSLAATYGFRQDEGFGGGTSFRINRYADPLTYFDQAEDQDESETSHMGSLALDYRLSANTALNASLQAGTEREVEREVGSFLELDANRALLNDYERLVDERGDGWNADVRVGLTHNFDGVSGGRSGTGAPSGGDRGRHGWGGGRDGGSAQGGGKVGHNLTVEARYDASANDQAELFTERITDLGDVLERQDAFTDRNRQEGALQVDYVRPLGGYRLEAGYKGDLERMYSDLYSESADGDAPMRPDAGLINAFDYDQNIHAVYLQLARQWGALGVQAGLRAETAQTTFALQNTAEAFDNDYTSLFPSAFLTYKLAEAHLVKASYSRRIDRPRSWSLNPFPSFDDPLNIRVGNPALKPEYTDAVELGYVHLSPWGSVTLTPYYRRTTDVVRRYQEVRDDGVTVRTVDNFDASTSSGIELITSMDTQTLLPGLRGYVSFEGFRMVTDGSNVNTDFQNDAFGWGGRLNASYELGNTFGMGNLDLQATLRYRAPMDTEQGRIGAFSWTDLALQQALLGDRASLTLRIRDLFGTAGFSAVTDLPNLYNEFEREFGAQAVGLTFTYSFGQEQRQNRRREGRPDGGGGFEGGDLD